MNIYWPVLPMNFRPTVCSSCNQHQLPVATTPIQSPMFIRCSRCQRHFHLQCTTLEEYLAYHFSNFRCVACAGTWQCSNAIPVLSPRRYKWWLMQGIELPFRQVGSIEWTAYFKGLVANEIPYQFPATDKDVCSVNDGLAFAKKIAEYGGLSEWKFVCLVKNTNGLKTTWPGRDEMGMERFGDLLGREQIVAVDDVHTNIQVSMKLSTLLNMMQTEPRGFPFNMVPLDISKIPNFQNWATPPVFVTNTSIVDLIWSTNHQNLAGTGKTFVNEQEKPCLEQKIFIDMRNTFKNVTMSPSGSSTLIYIIEGVQMVIVAPPTQENAIVYRMYRTDGPDTSSVIMSNFKQTRSIDVHPGEVLAIPAGWIYCVWNKSDTFGIISKYLHLGAFEAQFKYYEMELDILKIHNYPMMFPHFEPIHWMFVKNVVTPRIKSANAKKDDVRIKNFNLWEARNVLLNKLNDWLQKEEQRLILRDAVAGDVVEMKDIIEKFEEEIAIQETIQEELKKP